MLTILPIFYVKLRQRPGCAFEGVDAFFLLPLLSYLLLAHESVR